MNKKPAFTLLFIAGVVVLALIAFLDPLNLTSNQQEGPAVEEVDRSEEQTIEVASTNDETPSLQAQVIVSGLDHPWDLVMLDSGSYIFTQRSNKISYLENGQLTILAEPEDVYVRGEGGMLGLALDPDFDKNNYVYACFNSQEGDRLDVRVARWVFDAQNKTLSQRQDIITNIPSNRSGRHSGCRLAFGPDGYLWVGTGDAAQAENPQSPNSLGGKILRVDRDGQAAPDNLGEPFDPRIYSYGHRNVQGLGFFDPAKQPNLVGISAEHGPDRDDEVNPLVKGNFGWDPLPNYGEGVPMTDRDKFPQAIGSIWSSGSPTLALSGGTVIKGEQWLAWDQAVAVGALKTQKVMILELDEELNVAREQFVFEGDYGRIRTVVQGVDGNLYLLTDNGSNQDQIIKVIPQ